VDPIAHFVRYIAAMDAPYKGGVMLLKFKSPEMALMRPRVTPDPAQAEKLLRRMSEMSYSPENGFHRDRAQSRTSTPRLRLVR
jgi:hypothetical protein